MIYKYAVYAFSLKMLQNQNTFCVIWIGDDFESSLLSFEKLDRASPDLWPEQCKFTSSLPLCVFSLLNCVLCNYNPDYLVISHIVPGVAEFAASCKNVS